MSLSEARTHFKELFTGMRGRGFTSMDRAWVFADLWRQNLVELSQLQDKLKKTLTESLRLQKTGPSLFKEVAVERRQPGKPLSQPLKDKIDGWLRSEARSKVRTEHYEKRIAELQRENELLEALIMHYHPPAKALFGIVEVKVPENGKVKIPRGTRKVVLK